MSDLRDKIARALKEYSDSQDTPEEREMFGDQLTVEDFHGDAAAVLAVLDLDKVRAEAWDEGHEAAAMRVPEGVWADVAEPHPGNPYRKADR